MSIRRLKEALSRITADNGLDDLTDVTIDTGDTEWDIVEVRLTDDGEGIVLVVA